MSIFDKGDSGFSGLNQLLALIGNLEGLGGKKERKEEYEKGVISGNLDNIIKASSYANSRESSEALQGTLNNLAPEIDRHGGELNLEYNLTNQILNNKGASVNRWTTAMEQAGDIINNSNFLDRKSDFTDLTNPDGDLHNLIMKETNKDGSKKYESIAHWVSNEYARIEQLDNIISSGRKKGYIYDKDLNIDIDIQGKMESYKKRLNIAVRTLIGDDFIHPEEAVLIIAGDADEYQTIKRGKISQIKSEIEEYDSLIKFIDRTLIKPSKKTDENTQIALLEELVSSSQETGEEEIDFQSHLEVQGVDLTSSLGLRGELETAQREYEIQRNKRADAYKVWDGFGYQGMFKSKSNIESEDFRLNTEERNANEEGEFEFLDETNDEFEKRMIEEGKISKEALNIPMNITKQTGKNLVENYIKKIPGSEDELKNILNQMDEFDSSVSASDILNLAGEQKLLTVAGNVGIGTGKQLLEGKPTKNVSTKDFEDKAKRAGDIINEWMSIDKQDAGTALGDYLQGNENLITAANKAKPKDSPKWRRFASTHSGVRWRHVRDKIHDFKAKFKKSGLKFEEFKKQNLAEFRNISRQLKYGKYYTKSHI